jgi:hypothetical protein
MSVIGTVYGVSMMAVYHLQHASQSSGGVRSSAESKQTDLVASTVCVTAVRAPNIMVMEGTHSSP